MDVSVIIVNWNTRDILRNCLDSIFRETDEIDYEVIVIDNASTDDSVEMLKAEYTKVKLIENDRNAGFAAANNQGMKIAQGRYILLLNSDTIVLDKAIQKTIQFADENPETGIIGCRVMNSDGSFQPTCFMYPSLPNMILSATYLYKIFPKSPFFGRERMTWWDRSDVRQVEVVTGCFMLVRQKAIEQVGLMDEDYFMYGEETDWCKRFAQAGWKLMFTPSAEIIHLGGQSTALRAAEMNARLRLSVLRYLKKNDGLFHYYIGCLFTLGFLLLRLPVWAVIALLSQTKKQVALTKVRSYWICMQKIIQGERYW